MSKFLPTVLSSAVALAFSGLAAAYELGARTVAVFPYEDRNSLHRLKADESYQIGETGHPVRAYLSVDEIIRIAQQAGADAVAGPRGRESVRRRGVGRAGHGASVLRLRLRRHGRAR